MKGKKKKGEKKEEEEEVKTNLDILGDDGGMLGALHVVKADRFTPAIAICNLDGPQFEERERMQSSFHWRDLLDHNFFVLSDNFVSFHALPFRSF